MNFDPVPFDLVDGLLQWGAALGIVFGGLFLLTLVISLVTQGARGPVLLIEQIGAAFRDWLSISPRRVMAIALNTFRESWRKKVFSVGVIFVLLIMFAGWFMGSNDTQPAVQVKLFVSFILTAISWLILPLIVLLACWGLPDDIKARSLHTVVTKPVYRSEVVMGRILGFTAIGTIALVVMGGAGYLWLQRQINDANRSALVARVPVYGEISWLDRQGQPTESGINVGDEDEFRSFIAGSSQARAIWDFENVSADSLRTDPQTGEPVLVLESSFQVFRSFKGDLERGIRARYTFVNPTKNLRAPYTPFEVKEFRDGANVEMIPRKLTIPGKGTVDLIDDLVDDGKLRVEVECLTTAQFIGMARPDLFIRLPDENFGLNFLKALFGIWMLMVLAVVLCVGLSCLVKGPVATLAACAILVVGKSFAGFLSAVAAGKMEGGGVVESMIRIYTHTTPNIEFQESTAKTVVENIDKVPNAFLQVCQRMIPNLGVFDFTEYVASGFNVPFSAAMLPAIAVLLGFTIPWIFLAYLALKFRELESK